MAVFSGLNLSSADDILKVDYQDAIRDQLDNINVVWAMMEKKTVPHRGKDFYVALRTGRNEGTGFRGEFEDLPEHGHQSYESAVFERFHQYTRISLTGQVMEATVGDNAAFADALDSEINGAVEDTARDANRVVWGDGTGCLSAVDAYTTDANIPVQSTVFLRRNQKIIPYTTGDSTHAMTGGSDPVYIKSVTPSSTGNRRGTITVSNAIGGDAVDADWAAGRIYRAGKSGTAHATTLSEANGIGNLVSDSNTLGGIDRSSDAGAFWKSTIRDGTGATMPTDWEEELQTTLDLIDINEGGKIDFMVTSHQYRNSYFSALQQDRRFVVESRATDLPGGFSAVLYNDIPFAVDRDASGITHDGNDGGGQAGSGALDVASGEPWTGHNADGDNNACAGSVVFLSTQHMFVAQTGDPKWIDVDGSILREISNKDAVEATWRRYFNVVTDKGAAHGRLDLPSIS
tara:strand:+ start:6968 stop:8344 length:1377 start_codon:yes stop_codon:yes gene_type:complete